MRAVKLLGRTLFALAFTTMVAGVATCYFGIQHEIAKIPPEQRARMTDTDWVGVEWVALGSTIFAGGIVVLVITIAFRAWRRSHPVQRESE